MPTPPPSTRYSPWVRRLHWIVFALVTIALILIYIHAWTPRTSPTHAAAKWAHMQFGFAVLLVMFARLLVRTRSGKAPPIVPSMPTWQTVGAKTVHVALYVLLFAVPLLGIANRMWNPAPWDILGIAMPHFPNPERHFAHRIEDIHETLGNVVMYLAAAHALIALFHHFVRRDNTLARMLPARRR